jgi:hypothetical protein
MKLQKMEKMEGILNETVQAIKSMETKLERAESTKERLQGETSESIQEAEGSTYASIFRKGLPESHKFGEIIKQVVSEQSKVNQDKEMRDCNIVIYKAVESKAKNVNDRRIHDQQFFDELCCNALDIEIEAKEIFRLGKPTDDNDRPLKIVLRSKEEATLMHEAARKLKNAEEKFSRIVISRDLSPRERDELRELVEEAKAKNQENKASEWEYKVRSKGPHWIPKIVRLWKKEKNVPSTATEVNQVETSTETSQGETASA